VIRVGPAGWKYKDWGGIVYPQLSLVDSMSWPISLHISTRLKINTSYYGPPRPSTAKKWLESVARNGAFKFSAKLFHSFTHERNPGPDDEREFKDGIDPLVKADRLGAFRIFSQPVPP
jgi:uncharacterized protein YecE (DUF72 family)